MADQDPKIQQMFAQIAPRYDFLNRVLSAGIDQRWRRAAVQLAVLPTGGKLLDVATGTGDVALLALKIYRGQITVTGCDFCQPMLDIAQKKADRTPWAQLVSFVYAPAERLPFADASFDAVTIAFGIRNVSDRLGALTQMRRVLKNEGKCVVLEFANPTGLFGVVYRLYFLKILPWIGGLFSRRQAYEYLPGSVLQFPQPKEFANLMRQAGFGEVVIHNLTGGIATIYVGK